MVTTYAMYAMHFLRIDEDNNGLFVEVPGMSENWFKVRVDESGLVPTSTHCRCSHFAHKGHCQHTQIVDAFYVRIYKSNVVKHQESIVKANEKALEQAMNEAEMQELAYEEVAFSEQVLAATEKDQTPLIVTPAPVATPPVLNGQVQVPAWLAILPSYQRRQKSKVA